ncbi:MAG: class I SAM-dependent methyltransferase [Candidatus Helarchaeota archaeon]
MDTKARSGHNSEWEDKKKEIEYFEKIERKKRPEWGSQWDSEMMSYIRQMGSEKTMRLFYQRYIPNSTCLIVGLGGGGDAVLVKDLARMIIGIDITKLPLVEARNRGIKGEFIACDAEFLPFREKIFSSIIIRSTLHHLPHVEADLSQFAKVLQKDGALILQEPGLLNPIALIGRTFFPTNRHTPGERPFVPLALQNRIKSDLIIVKSEYHYLFSHFLPILWKVLPKKLKKVKILDLACDFDKFLLKTPLKQLCWIFTIVAIKKI